MIIWIIGKSGSGKSFLAKNLYKKLKKKLKKIKWIDGDKFRKKHSSDLGYSKKDRRENSKRIQAHCRFYDKKKYIVICSILSIFKEHQKRNRKIFSDYFQIYINVRQKMLEKKNNKKIYSLKKDVVGKNLKFPYPYKNDMRINNFYDKKFLKNIKLIEQKIYERI